MASPRAKYAQVNLEVESAFAVENGSHSWISLPVTSVEPNLINEALPDETLHTDRGEHAPIVGSQAGSTLKLGTHASGLGTPAGDGVAATRTGLGNLLEAAIGDEVLTTGSTIKAAGGHVLTPTVNGTGDFAPNTWAGFVTPNFGTVWRFIASVAVAADDILTLAYALPEAPASGALVYGSANYQFEDPAKPSTSLQVQCLYDASDSKWLALGVMPDTLTIEKVSPTKLPMVSIECKVAAHDDNEGDAFTFVAPSSKGPFMLAGVLLVPFGTTAYNAAYSLKARDVALAFARGLIPRWDPEAAQGVGGWDEGAETPFKLTVTVPMTDDWRDAFRAQTNYHAHLILCSTAGKAYLVYLRKLHVTKDPGPPGNDAGISTTTVEFALTAGYVEPAAVVAQG